MSELSASEAAAATGSAKRPEITVRELKAAYRSAAFGDIVSILMRSPRHKRLALETLRIFVVPAIANQQFLIAKVKPQMNDEADPMPAGVAIWASVSEEVDQRLRSNASEPVRIKPDEWTSGDRLWLIDLVAPPALVPALLRDLDQKVARGREMNTQIRTKDNEPRVATLKDLIEELPK